MGPAALGMSVESPPCSPGPGFFGDPAVRAVAKQSQQAQSPGRAPRKRGWPWGRRREARILASDLLHCRHRSCRVRGPGQAGVGPCSLL